MRVIKILKEELIGGISPDQITELNKLNGSQLVQKQVELLKKVFGNNYSKIIDTSNKNTNILHWVLESLRNYGWDTSNNKTLELLQLMSNKNTALPSAGFQVVSDALQKKLIDINKDQDWLVDKNSYTSLFKTKALTLLSSDKALNFGDNPQYAKNTIMGMTDDKQIRTFLSNWQTKEGTQAESETVLNQIQKYIDGVDTTSNGKVQVSTGTKDSLKRVGNDRKDVLKFFTTNEGRNALQAILYDSSNGEYDDIIAKLGNVVFESYRKSPRAVLTEAEDEQTQDNSEQSKTAITKPKKYNLDELDLSNQYWGKQYRQLLNVLTQSAVNKADAKNALRDYLDNIQDDLISRQRQFNKEKREASAITDNGEKKSTNKPKNYVDMDALKNDQKKAVKNDIKALSGKQALSKLSGVKDPDTKTLQNYIVNTDTYKRIAQNDDLKASVDNWVKEHETLRDQDTFDYLLNKRRYNNEQEFEKVIDSLIRKYEHE